MANRYFINGGVNDLLNSTLNWSDVSGGAGGFSVPGAGDVAHFDANSPLSATTGGNIVIGGMDFTGWTGGVFNFASTHTIQITGGLGLTFIAAMSFTYANAANKFVLTTASCAFTTGGQTLQRIQFQNSAVTYTITGNLTVTTLLELGNSGTTTLNGGNIYCQGNCTHSGNNVSIAGTTTIHMTGTGTIQTTGTGSARFVVPIVINTAGTITFGTTLRVGGPVTWTAGTVVTAGNTFELSSSATTLDIAGITLNNFTATSSVTHTLTSDVNVTGLFTWGSTTGTTVINGSAINCTGGVRYGGTSGRCSGTTVINVNGPQTIDAPSALATGEVKSPMVLNAPGGTITILTGFAGDLSRLSIIDGTTVVNVTDSFTPGAGGSSDGFYVEAM